MRNLQSGIPGINRTSLWNAWKQIRQEARHSSIRDVVDWLDFDLDPEVWISRLLEQLRQGTYEPRTPQRFTLAKAQGFSRRMTLPHVRDLVLYRALTSHCYKRASRKESPHVYFEQSRLAKVQGQVVEEAQQVIRSPYTGFRRRRFLTWLRYEQYRKHLILEKVYPCVVVSDVTNFFDSILYDRVADSLAGIASAKMIGLLFFLLERLSIRDAYSATPSVGLPVDQFDCSRALAHMVLFPHDERMVKQVGEHAYVRWMDDQNCGVASRAEGLKALAVVGESLARLHLTANSGKSKVLSLAEAKRHYHLDLNAILDSVDGLPSATAADRKKLRVQLKKIWSKARRHEGTGEWDKILKRTYRIAALAQARSFRSRAVRDVRMYPQLIDRIADYVRTTGTPAEYISFTENAWKHPEQIYPDVNAALCERLLMLEPSGHERSRIRQLAIRLLRGGETWPGAQQCMAVAPLLLLRFGDRRNLTTLSACLERVDDVTVRSVSRSLGIVYASFGKPQFTQMRKTAARIFRNELSEAVKMIERVLQYDNVPDRFRNRFEPIWDAVRGQHYVDTRRLLGARLLQLNSKPAIRNWIEQRKTTVLNTPTISDFDKDFVRRILN